MWDLDNLTPNYRTHILPNYGCVIIANDLEQSSSSFQTVMGTAICSLEPAAFFVDFT